MSDGQPPEQPQSPIDDPIPSEPPPVDPPLVDPPPVPPQTPPTPPTPGAAPSGPGPQPGPGWWLASDGNWYPPDKQPGYTPQTAPTSGPWVYQGGAVPGYPLPVDPQAKSKIAAGLLGIFLGGFGIHRFYLGYTQIGVIQIVVTILTCGLGALWGFIEGILILVGQDGFTTDAEGRPLRD